jgi:hypothetical protein
VSAGRTMLPRGPVLGWTGSVVLRLVVQVSGRRASSPAAFQCSVCMWQQHCMACPTVVSCAYVVLAYGTWIDGLCGVGGMCGPRFAFLMLWGLAGADTYNRPDDVVVQESGRRASAPAAFNCLSCCLVQHCMALHHCVMHMCCSGTWYLR